MSDGTAPGFSALPEFAPPWPLRNAHVQSVLASSEWRASNARKRFPALSANARSIELDCGHGVRLLGALSVHEKPKGLIVAFHGWEGSVDSSYLLSTCGRLYDDGFDIFRLNFRDHGPTHHLNPEVFHSCRLTEVVNAVAEVLRMVPTRPVALIGFSLGGNFALRVALKAPERGLAIRYVVSVCAPLNPAHSLKAIEASRFVYHHYFMRKWRDSLKRKHELFPALYQQLPAMLKHGDLRAVTARLVEEYTEYTSIDDYLDGYSIARERLNALHVPALLIGAVDDPVIPVSDYAELSLPAHIERNIQAFGGHCGFLKNRQLESWVEEVSSQRLREALLG
jgi:hypothetical protein